jgi:hypothetical protein
MEWIENVETLVGEDEGEDYLLLSQIVDHEEDCELIDRVEECFDQMEPSEKLVHYVAGILQIS